MIISFLAALCASLFSPGFISAKDIAAREVLPSGLTLLHSEKKDLPLVIVVMAIKAGSVVESPDKAGLANLTADLLNEGTLSRTSQEISDAIEFVGGSLSVSGDEDVVTVKLSILKKDLDLGFDLLSDILMRPAFKEAEIERRKALIKSAILQQQEDPGALASKAFRKNVFGDYPYAWPPEGTLESLDRITRNDIVGLHHTHYVPNNSIMSVVGDIARGELNTVLGKYFRDWEKKDVPAPALPSLGPTQKKKVIRIQKDISQANIILGHLGIARENPDYYAVTVMNYILGGGGFASRLMDNIRDDKGLSYDVYSFFSARKYAGSFQAGLQTKNQSANTAIREIQKEMERIRTEPVSERELEDAKSYLTGSFPLRIDSLNKIASFLTGVEYYGLGLDYVNRYPEYINAVSADDIMRVAKKYLNSRDFVLVIVGNLEKMSLQESEHSLTPPPL